MDETNNSVSYVTMPPQVSLRIQISGNNATKNLNSIVDKLEDLKNRIPGLSFVDVSVNIEN